MVPRFAGVGRKAVEGHTMVERSWTSGASVAGGEVDCSSVVLRRKLYDGAAVSETVVGKVLGGYKNAVGVVVTQGEGFRQANVRSSKRRERSGLEAAGLKRDGRVAGEEGKNRLDRSCKEAVGEGVVV